MLLKPTSVSYRLNRSPVGPDSPSSSHPSNTSLDLYLEVPGTVDFPPPLFSSWTLTESFHTSLPPPLRGLVRSFPRAFVVYVVLPDPPPLTLLRDQTIKPSVTIETPLDTLSPCTPPSSALRLLLLSFPLYLYYSKLPLFLMSLIEVPLPSPFSGQKKIPLTVRRPPSPTHPSDISKFFHNYLVPGSLHRPEPLSRDPYSVKISLAKSNSSLHPFHPSSLSLIGLPSLRVRKY